MKALLLAKTALDLAAAIGFAWKRNWPMAALFGGFAIADAGSLWMTK